MGFSVVLASTNNISPRLRAVERFLTLAISGGPGILFDKERNTVLLQAMMHSYRFARDRKGALAEIPEKKHPASDLADALQYLCLSVGSNVIAREVQAPPARSPTFSSAAWT
jgi:hypothetical protein